MIYRSEPDIDYSDTQAMLLYGIATDRELQQADNNIPPETLHSKS